MPSILEAAINGHCGEQCDRAARRQAIAELLRAVVDVNGRGRPPLNAALLKREFQLARDLLKAGANPSTTLDYVLDTTSRARIKSVRQRRQQLQMRSEQIQFLLEHGAIDMIVHRTEMRDTIAGLLSKLTHQPLNNKEVEEPEPQEDEPTEESGEPAEGDE